MHTAKKFVIRNLRLVASCGAILLFFNLILFVLWGIGISKSNSVKNVPWQLADSVAAGLRKENGVYQLDPAVQQNLHHRHVWAMLVADNSGRVVWGSDLPAQIPRSYRLSDIAEMSRTYLNGYPTFTSPHQDGLVVLGFQKNSYLKLQRNNFNNLYLENLPAFFTVVFLADVLLLFVVYIMMKRHLFEAVGPLLRGLQNWQAGKRTPWEETGPFAEVAATVNKMLRTEKGNAPPQDSPSKRL